MQMGKGSLTPETGDLGGTLQNRTPLLRDHTSQRSLGFWKDGGQEGAEGGRRRLFRTDVTSLSPRESSGK